ncbi:SCO family protein [Uliginosibacterium sp. H3]|uniref:SCO family protein n=1 Tax=Uliginosibacterium silvisoli TaxID=3114758 RepID=A0ABU6K2B9_9RHOO|nr:SCO family protein [Uliginosibacterium sp. H3]
MRALTVFPRVLAALLLASLLAACDKAPQFNATDITGADYGAALNLPDASGKSRSIGDFSGKVVAVFFGYTQCPDACPTSLALMADVTNKLGEDGKRLQVILVSVDPERDTPELLGQYVTAFNPGFIAMRGTLAQTKAVAQSFNVFYEKRGDIAGGKYTMDHTAGIYLFDTKGRARLFVRYGETPENLLADIKLLLSGK